MGILKRLPKKKGIVLFFLIIIFLPWINADVTTELNISKIPPLLVNPIPNQSWVINSGLANAFDLDDYFESSDGSLLTYTYSPVNNITIVIDSSNEVSFYSDIDFSGERNVTFNANDEGLNTTSNLVYLFVGTDQEPPKWSSPIRSKNKIYQNDYVNFSVSWTDNVQLKNYLFSINQGSGWLDYPEVNFRGIKNNSISRVQISAPGGGLVYWKFCAKDTSDNLNCTPEEIFNVTNLPVPPPSGGGGEGGEGSGEQGQQGGLANLAAAFIQNKKINKFSFDPLYFKISLKQGAIDTRILKITNIGAYNMLINLSVIGLEKFILLSKENLNLSFGETEKITVDFNSKKDTFPEQYFGKIILSSNAGIVGVPVILDVTPFDVAIDIKVNISDKYKSVLPGKTAYATITISNLKEISPDEFTLYFAIKDLYGNIYDSSQEKISLASVYSAEKNLTVPLNAQEGEYIFYARISNDKVSNIDSDIFEVGQRFKLGAFLKSSFIFLFIVVLFSTFLILVFKYKKEKGKEKLLSLYLMLNELKELIKQEKVDQAIDLYIRLKNSYGERVSKTALDKERLKEEMKDLSKKLNSQIEESGRDMKDISKESNKAGFKPKNPKKKSKNKQKRGRRKN